MANALKRLKENEIESFFVLGEHDISRVRSTPIPYVYHNLEFSKYVGRGEPVYYKDVMIVGFDKIRKNEMTGLEENQSKDNVSKDISDSKIELKNIQDDIAKKIEINQELEEKIKKNQPFFSDSENQKKKIDEELNQRKNELEVLKKRLGEMKKTDIKNNEGDDSKNVVEAASQIIATTNKRLQDTTKELEVVRQLLDKERKAHNETKKKSQS